VSVTAGKLLPLSGHSAPSGAADIMVSLELDILHGTALPPVPVRTTTSLLPESVRHHVLVMAGLVSLLAASEIVSVLALIAQRRAAR
jgi:hypothetical protein